jgi:hypothetical protein
VELANFAALASCWHSSRTPATSSRFMTWARLASLDRVANLCTAALPDSPPRGDDQLLQVVQRVVARGRDAGMSTVPDHAMVPAQLCLT